MHEYSIVAALIDRVDGELAARGGGHVKKLKVRIGELAGVDVPLLETAFTTFRGETSCRDAELVIEAIEARWACPRCQATLERGAILRCPTCEVPARLSSGDEIVLQTIEMEVPDVH